LCIVYIHSDRTNLFLFYHNRIGSTFSSDESLFFCFCKFHPFSIYMFFCKKSRMNVYFEHNFYVYAYDKRKHITDRCWNIKYKEGLHTLLFVLPLISFLLIMSFTSYHKAMHWTLKSLNISFKSINVFAIWVTFLANMDYPVKNRCNLFHSDYLFPATWQTTIWSNKYEWLKHASKLGTTSLDLGFRIKTTVLSSNIGVQTLNPKPVQHNLCHHLQWM
jgi:hypothetical protein